MPLHLRDDRAGPAGVRKAEFRLHFTVLLPSLGAITFANGLFPSFSIALGRSSVSKKVKISGND